MITKIQIIMVVVLFLAIGIGLTVIQQQRKKIEMLVSNLDRWTKNYEEIQKQTVKTLTFTQEEFLKQMDKRTDSLLKANKVNPKTVQNITYITNKYTIADTSDFKISNKKKIDSLYSYDMSFDTNCVSIKGIILVRDSINPVVKLTKLDYGNDQIIAEVIKKEARVPWISFLWNWKKRPTYVEQLVETNCGKTEVRKINILK